MQPTRIRALLGGVPLMLAAMSFGCGGSNDHDPAGDATASTPVGGVAVHAAKVVRTSLRSRVVAYGTVEPEPATTGRPAASANVSPAASAVVTEVRCSEGQRVERGQILFSLDARAADLALLEAEQQFDFAEKEFARQKTMRPGGGTSVRKFQEAERNLAFARTELEVRKTQRSYMDVASPLGGTVVHVRTRVGEAVGPGDSLAEVIDLDRVVAIVRIPERERTAIRVGQSAALGSGAGPTGENSPHVTGTVSFIGSRLDPTSGTVPAWISFPADAGLLPGRFVEVRIVTAEHTDRLAVPEEALVPDADGNDSVVVVDDAVASHLPVVIGLRDGGLVEVAAEALVEGMTVVTSGAYGLPDGSPVNVLREPADAPAAGEP